MVIALEIEGAGLSLVAVEGSAGGAWDLDVVVVHLAVAEDGDVPADESDVEGCPLPEVVGSARGGG